jgi:UDP-glucose 4-epimerase
MKEEHMEPARVRFTDGPTPEWYFAISALHEDTGFAPQSDVEAGIADYIAWLRAGNER